MQIYNAYVALHIEMMRLTGPTARLKFYESKISVCFCMCRYVNGSNYCVDIEYRLDIRNKIAISVQTECETLNKNANFGAK